MAAPVGELSEATMAVLDAMYVMDEHGLRLTVRGVAEIAGRSPGRVHLHLLRLRNAGLVMWDPGKQGTLRLPPAGVDVRAMCRAWDAEYNAQHDVGAPR